MPPELPREMNSENSPGMIPGVGFDPAILNTNTAEPTARPPSVYKMRCPTCQKLYSVQAQVILSASLPLQFQCQSCQTRFETPLMAMQDLYNEILTTREIAPLVGQNPEPVASGDVACPKCRGLNAAGAAECKHCGIVFEKFNKASRIEKNDEFGGRREIVDMWNGILEDYSNQEKHDRFVEDCYRAGALAFAAQKYSRILGAAPNEDIAKAMRRRIIALSSFKTETATASAVRKEAAESQSATGGIFRYFKVSHMVFMVGGALIASGILLPASKDLIGLGFAMILLAVGVVYFRPKA